MELKKLVAERLQYLQEVLEQKEEEIKKLPSGRIRAINKNGKYHYYLRKEAKEKTGNYIRDKYKSNVAAMLQREYVEKVINCARRELKIIKMLNKVYQKPIVEEVYERLPKGKQVLVVPLNESEEQFLNRWMNEPFVRKGFAENAPEYYSENKERMRSKSEVLIANMLRANGIPYIYEKPLSMKGIGYIYPDFTILDSKNRRIFILEHLGMMDDPEYVNRQIRKIRDYQYNGYFLGDNLLLSFENAKRPLNIRQVEEMVLHAFRR